MVRQWQAWLSLRATERWMHIVTAASRNVAPLKHRAPDYNELADFGRAHFDTLREAADRILKQVRRASADRRVSDWRMPSLADYGDQEVVVLAGCQQPVANGVGALPFAAAPSSGSQPGDPCSAGVAVVRSGRAHDCGGRAETGSQER